MILVVLKNLFQLIQLICCMADVLRRFMSLGQNLTLSSPRHMALLWAVPSLCQNSVLSYAIPFQQGLQSDLKQASLEVLDW